MATDEHAAHPREPLGPGYRRLLSAGALGNLGDGIALVALPWYASTLTDDPLAVSAVGVALRLPWLLFALLAGVAGDRVDRRRLMVLSGTGKALVLAALTALVAADAAGIPAVMAAALLVGVCEVFFDNTAQSLLPALVPRERLERANGTLWSVEEVAGRFVGAPVAGLLIALSMPLAFGAQSALTGCAVLFLVALRGDFHPGRPADGVPRASVRDMLAEGVRWLWGHRLLRALAVVLALSNLAASMNGVILVLFAQDVLGLGSRGYGLLLTAVAVGMVAGAQVVPWLIPRFPPGATLTAVLAVQATAYTAVAVVPGVAVFAVLWVLVGFSTVWWNVLTVSLRQRIIPDRLLSRVLSAYRTIGWGTAPVGMALAGVIASGLEPVLGRQTALSAPFLVAGGISAVLVLLSARHLTTARIRAALDAAEGERADGGG
ncbi:MFS transporter [Nocardiopsis tropica]|uniref:MFS transporter n=1 Tax=Nocardiopsis tropica TaxID=109330 RepID=A0ABU7KN20_9ACTN|nr:MFS transporter [Nocardiopsis umidischolae]MEE2050674.1 MFS transporter [Nocardiopsis umidischolae]